MKIEHTNDVASKCNVFSLRMMLLCKYSYVGEHASPKQEERCSGSDSSKGTGGSLQAGSHF